MYEQLADSVRKGACILFLGAGVHHEPPAGSGYEYAAGERPPLGGDLAARLAGDCNFSKICPGERDRDLPRVAHCYEQVRGRVELVQRIEREVEDTTEPSAALRALAELPFPLVMTTNYDTLFERALRRDAVRKRPFVGVYEPDRNAPATDYPPPNDPSIERPFVFKVHGDVSNPTSLVVTDDDYITFVLRMNGPEGQHPIPRTFRYQLNRWPTLFLGYGLLDYNLRLLFRTLRWNLDKAVRPNSYSVDVAPDPLVGDDWKQEHGLRFIVEDVWNFVPRLYQEVTGQEMPR